MRISDWSSDVCSSDLGPRRHHLRRRRRRRCGQRRHPRRLSGKRHMTELFQFTLFGLMLGCVYAIAAMGLVLTYTVTGVFNFAHGAVGMIAAFVYYELRVDRKSTRLNSSH